MIRYSEIRFACRENCVKAIDNLCRALEGRLGIKLHADYIGDIVHGDITCVYYHTTGRGEITIRLYEEEEAPVLTPREYELASAEVKAKSRKLPAGHHHSAHSGHFKPHGLSRAQIDEIEKIVTSVVRTARKIKG